MTTITIYEVYGPGDCYLKRFVSRDAAEKFIAAQIKKNNGETKSSQYRIIEN